MIDKWWKGQNVWFDRFYADAITDEFAEWWSSGYARVENYIPSTASLPMEEERNEYFIRMAFAWLGWNARRKQ